MDLDEAVDENVMRHMIARAVQEKARADAFVANPSGSDAGACTYMQDVWRRRSKQTVEEIAKESYDYLLYRSRAMQGGRLIDPAARLEWDLLASPGYADCWPVCRGG